MRSSPGPGAEQPEREEGHEPAQNAHRYQGQEHHAHHDVSRGPFR